MKMSWRPLHLDQKKGIHSLESSRVSGRHHRLLVFGFHGHPSKLGTATIHGTDSKKHTQAFHFSNLFLEVLKVKDDDSQKQFLLVLQESLS